MPKIQGDVRRRMREAALALFSEKGFDRTTAAEIAARAGVTERTFFRHFPDKREVLFNEAELQAKLDVAIAEAPAELGPLEVVVWAFQSLTPMFEENLPLADTGQAVIAQTPALQERQLAKRPKLPGRLPKRFAVATSSLGLQTWPPLWAWPSLGMR